jgi:hypothetical protein
MSNPFQKSMVTLQVPPGMGSVVSAGGFMLEVDANGCIEVPSDIAAELKQHGMVEPGAPAKKK